jgi:3-oxoacyl-[acyl-carrier protein] reductase
LARQPANALLDERLNALPLPRSAPDGAHKLALQVRAIMGDRLDILVANAGTSKAAAIEDVAANV